MNPATQSLPLACDSWPGVATLPAVLADTVASPGIASLPGPALCALLVGVVWGVLLLAFGAALLRPMVVIAALLTGLLLAVVAARTWLPTLPLWVAAAVGSVLGVIAGALLYRPAVASMSAVVGATLGALVAWSVIAAGALDAKPRTSEHALVASLREESAQGEGYRTSREILAIVMARADDAVVTGVADLEHAAGDAAERRALAAQATPPTAGDRVLRDLSEIARRAAERTREALAATAPAYRTLMYGCIATGALVGLLAGLLATTTVARILTSAAGATLLLTALVPLSAALGHALYLRDARAWLLAIASLTVLGLVAQTLLGSRLSGSRPKGKAARKGAARPAEPAPKGGAAAAA